MLRKEKWLAITLAILLVTSFLPLTAKANSRTPIVVGSKSFAESKTVSEIYALALEHAGYKVIRKPNIANSVVYRVVKTGQVDVYPEYTGTIVETYLKKNGSGLTASQMANVARKGVKKDGLVIFKYAPGDDRQGIGMRSSVAKKYHIKTISDLQKNAAKIRFVSQGEFDKRADALPGMNKKYGKFDFKSLRDYDDSLKYTIMAEGKGDAAPVSTTEGQLATSKYVLLKDDKGLWPPYNLVPLANKKSAKEHPKMAATLNRVDAKLTTKQLINLNKQVMVQGKNYRMVALNWYNQHMKEGRN